MKTFTTVLRQDLFAIRWVYTAWIATILSLVLLSANFNPQRLSNVFDYAYVFGLMTWVVLSAVLFARIALGHSPVDSRNGWRSRPLRPVVVALVKLLLIESVFLLPLLVNAWAAQNPPPVLEVALVLLAGLFVASLVSTQRALLAALLIVGILVVFIARLLVPLPTGFSLLPHGFSSTGLRVAQLTLAVGLIGLTVHHYARPHALGHSIAGAALLLLVGSLSWVFPDLNRPLPVLSRPTMQVNFLEAQSLTDADYPPHAFYAALDHHLSASTGHVPTHRNWQIRLEVTGLREDELWFTRALSWNATHRRGFGQRTPNAPVYFPSSLLLRRLGLPAGTRMLEPTEDTFTYTFQWVRFDGEDDFPEAPSPTDFQLNFQRVDEVNLYHRGPLEVGQLGPQLQITEIDPAAGTLTALAKGPTIRTTAPTTYHLRYAAPTLLIHDPVAHEAGIATRLPPENPERWREALHQPAPYRLPALSGDPADWEVLFFGGIADGQVIITGTPNSP